MKETAFKYNRRMQDARHYLTTGGCNFTGRGFDIFILWGKRGCPTGMSLEWKKFVNEVRVDLLGLPSKSITPPPNKDK